MNESVFFTLLYIIICVFMVYPPVEFISAGFTISSLFASFLGSENENFISYHIKRSIVTLLVYSCLPLGYSLLLLASDYIQDLPSLLFHGGPLWHIYLTSSLALPGIALYVAKLWTDDDCKAHPITRTLSQFANNNNTNDWRSVASAINVEFRRVDKVLLQPSPLVKVVATENWILKLTPFGVRLAHQADASLSVRAARAFERAQVLTIEVRPRRAGVGAFSLRVDAADFRDLQARVARDIAVQPHVRFHRSVADRFVEAFRATVAANARYEARGPLEACAGCMQAPPGVKLRRMCGGGGGAEERCGECFCRPMWCVDCMGRWFASRQEAGEEGAWLRAKCTCPMCRARFCLLDVSMIVEI